MIVTFNLYRLPTSVDVAWYKCKVNHYIPNPMRCKICQKLGHTKEYCSISEARRKYEENYSLNVSLNDTYASALSHTPTKRKDAIKNSEIPTTSNSIRSTLSKTTKQINEINSTSSIKNNTIIHSEIPTTSSSKSSTLPNTVKQINEIKSTSSALNVTSKLTETIKNNYKSTNTVQEKTPLKTTTSAINENYNRHTSGLTSPITSLTQKLIESNKYFVPINDGNKDEDMAIDLSSP